MKSTLYAPCPQCADKTLIKESMGTLVCAACAFDYTSMVDDPPRFEAHLVKLLKDGPLSQLAALELHRRLTKLPNVESIAKVRALASANGVVLPDPADANKMMKNILFVLVGFVFVIIAIVIALTR